MDIEEYIFIDWAYLFQNIDKIPLENANILAEILCSKDILGSICTLKKKYNIPPKGLQLGGGASEVVLNEFLRCKKIMIGGELIESFVLSGSGSTNFDHDLKNLIIKKYNFNDFWERVLIEFIVEGKIDYVLKKPNSKNKGNFPSFFDKNFPACLPNKTGPYYMQESKVGSLYKILKNNLIKNAKVIQSNNITMVLNKTNNEIIFRCQSGVPFNELKIFAKTYKNWQKELNPSNDIKVNKFDPDTYVRNLLIAKAITCKKIRKHKDIIKYVLEELEKLSLKAKIYKQESKHYEAIDRQINRLLNLETIKSTFKAF